MQSPLLLVHLSKKQLCLPLFILRCVTLSKSVTLRAVRIMQLFGPNGKATRATLIPWWSCVWPVLTWVPRLVTENMVRPVLGIIMFRGKVVLIKAICLCETAGMVVLVVVRLVFVLSEWVPSVLVPCL